MNLYNYLISEDSIATEGSNGEVLSGLASIALLAIGCGIAQAIASRKQKKEFAEKQKQLDAQKKAKEEKIAAWKASPEYQQLESRLQKKYGTPIKMNFDKLADNVSKDITKINSAFNRNKRQCALWADKYLQYHKSMGDDATLYGEDANDIRNGPCATPPNDYSGVYHGRGHLSFAVIDCSQDVAIWAGQEIIPAICEALNVKYADEIAYGLMSEFEHGGDGDEGLVESNLSL